MFQIGDRVVYGSHGVCQILAVEQRMVDRKRINYFALEPLNQTGARFYVPSENPAALAKLRHLISREELELLLASPEIRENCWIADENQRKQRYRDLISSGDRCALIAMVRTLHVQKDLQTAAGRKFHLCDENFLRDAEKLLSSEFSLVLGIQPGEVGAYIQKVSEK